MKGKVKGTTGVLTLERVRIEELKMLPSNAKIHSRQHIDKIARLNMKDTASACGDWHVAAKLGNRQAPVLIKKYCK